MKFFINMFLLVAFCGSELIKIPRPSIRGIRTFDLGFQITWSPVVSSSNDYPILGYKVSVWEPGYQSIYKLNETDGSRDLVKILKRAEPVNIREIPVRPPAIVVTTNSTSANIKNVQQRILYEIRVQAFTDGETGPMSSPVGFKFE